MKIGYFFMNLSFLLVPICLQHHLMASQRHFQCIATYKCMVSDIFSTCEWLSLILGLKWGLRSKMSNKKCIIMIILWYEFFGFLFFHESFNLAFECHSMPYMQIVEYGLLCLYFKWIHNLDKIEVNSIVGILVNVVLTSLWNFNVKLLVGRTCQIHYISGILVDQVNQI